MLVSGGAERERFESGCVMTSSSSRSVSYRAVDLNRAYIRKKRKSVLENELAYSWP